MLVPDGTAKILDFGLAKMRDVTVTKSQVTRGTLVYMAPDQLRGGRVDARADLWSVGVMLYVMLTASSRSAASTRRQSCTRSSMTSPSLHRRLVPGLPRAFDDLVGALLQKNPAHRYQSAEELLDDLEALDHGAALRHRVPLWARADTTQAVPPCRRHARLSRWFAVAIASLSWTVSRRPRRRCVEAPITAQSVAVLPFTNADANAADNYLVDGFSERLTALLGAQPGNRVAAGASAARSLSGGSIRTRWASRLGSRTSSTGACGFAEARSLSRYDSHAYRTATCSGHAVHGAGDGAASPRAPDRGQCRPRSASA
jgi:hypothetical protein